MDRIRVVLLSCTAVIVSLVVFRSGVAQGPDPLGGLNEEQKRSLAEPFKGATTNGEVAAGLFQIRNTGVSTAPVRAAAEAFLKALNEDQRKRLMFPVDDREWRIWINTPGPARQGVSFKEMSESQRTLAFDLLRASLSARGLQKTGDIMKLNETLAEITNNFGQFGQWAYWITVMGAPSATEPWGWQLDGHHCVINYFVLGDQVVMTPTFMGSEPVRADSGKFKGTTVLQDEQNKGLNLFTALAAGQRAKATVRSEKGPGNSLAGAYMDNVVLDYAGIRATDLNDRQREALLDLIAEYINNQKESHATLKMEEVRRHIASTYFAWIGNADPTGVFYYRVQSPVILIEFDHQRSVASPGQEATRNHIHTVVRTPNGNDYGKDLLRQHYAQHPHAAR
jgi:hypothetical protein